MVEKTEQGVEKKRRGKNGYRRVTVTLAETDYNYLAQRAEEQMREPNNLLSFLLRGELATLVERKIENFRG